MAHAISLPTAAVSHAKFTRSGDVIDPASGFLPGGRADLVAMLSAFETLDETVVDETLVEQQVGRLLSGDAVICGVDETGAVWTLSSHISNDDTVTVVAARSGVSSAPRTESAQLADVMKAMNQGCAVFDLDGQLIACNDLFRDMNSGVREFLSPGIGYETILREMARRRIVRQADGRQGAWIAEVLQAIEGEIGFEIERADGLTTAVSVGATSSGGFVISEIDITERRRAEHSAEASEQLLSTILKASPANLCMSQIGDGTIIYVSPSCTRLFGPLENARDQFADPLDRGDFLIDLLASGSVDDFSTQAQRLDGSTFPALFSARVIEYRGEEVMVSNVIDLTDQVAAESKITEAGIRLRDAIEALNEGFILYDADERVVMANQRFLEMNAPYAYKIVPGTHTRDLLQAAVDTGHFVDAAHWLADYEAELARGQGGCHRSFEFQTTDGTRITSLRRPTREGGFVITWLDVTEQRNATDAQALAADRMRDAIESLDVGFALFDDQDRLAIWNQRYEDLNRLIKDAVREGATYQEILEAAIQANGLDDDEAADVRATGSRKGGNTRLQYEYEAKSGGWFSVTRNPTSEDGFVITRAEITERKEAEAELARQQDMLHQSEKLSALGELLAGVAHELNNPLSVVVGHALMMEEEIADPVQLKRIRKISTAAERCSRIVKTFLAMARQRPTKLELISLNQVIETALEVAGYGLRSAGVELRLDLSEDLPPVNADADQLAQVLANLLVNAEHALAGLGGDGCLTIRTRLSRSGKEVVIEFADNGPGIPEKIRARIFEPFFTTKTVGEGTGIGLAFCHRVIASHKGQISVMESPDGGALFRIRLAAATPVRQVAVDEADLPASRGHVLVVDDEEDVAELIAGVLTKDGYCVTQTYSAEAALDVLPGTFDIILSDVNMPGLNGREFLDAIGERWPDMTERVGFITGDTMSAGAEHFLNATGRRYLEKPVTPSELRRLAADILGQ